jgi:hypothetical protein
MDCRIDPPSHPFGDTSNFRFLKGMIGEVSGLFAKPAHPVEISID